MNDKIIDHPFFIPPVIFGTSSLGNLFVELNDDVKKKIVEECFIHSSKSVVFDTAGKYGAGLALESLGKSLNDLNIRKDEVIISNKLGWLRTKLETPEPTFEPHVWKNLQHDAIQKISYEGILECFEQGNQLLNGYIPQMVSVHDPDEYLAASIDKADEEKRYRDILDAYRALMFLKKQGKVSAIGVGSKQWKIIERISNDTELDWIMVANSMTVKSHPPDLSNFIRIAADRGIKVINSAVFHGGFLTGGDFYDYVPVRREDERYKDLFDWRDRFNIICDEYHIKPAEACVAYGLKVAGVVSIALNTANPDRVAGNIKMAEKIIPNEFWTKLKTEGLISYF